MKKEGKKVPVWPHHGVHFCQCEAASHFSFSYFPNEHLQPGDIKSQFLAPKSMAWSSPGPGDSCLSWSPWQAARCLTAIVAGQGTVQAFWSQFGVLLLGDGARQHHYNRPFWSTSVSRAQSPAFSDAEVDFLLWTVRARSPRAGIWDTEQRQPQASGSGQASPPSLASSPAFSWQV